MKSFITLCTLFFLVGFVSMSCSDSTGQENEYTEQEAVREERSVRVNRAQPDDEDEWAEHRRNFGNRLDREARRESSNEEEDLRDRTWKEEDWARNDDIDLEIEKEEVKKELEEALSELGEALEEVGEALSKELDVEAVAYSELRSVLPGGIRGMEKGHSNAENIGVIGLKISTVEQEYVNEDDDERVDVKIVDMGSLSKAAAGGLDWLDLEIDSESTDGFERMIAIDGHPAFEKCHSDSWDQSCSLHLFVADRFIVQLDGENLTIERLHDILDDMDLNRLVELREYGL